MKITNVFMALFLLVFLGCSQEKTVDKKVKENPRKVQNDESEIIKEIFYHSRLLGYRV